MNFASATDYLLGTINETVSRRLPNRLDRMRAFLQMLGDPQDSYPTLHVGGTSGKGSTSTMLAAVLSASGRRTGLHTKPHLASVTERARVDGLAIPEESFAEILTEMMPVIERVAFEYGRPSYYETLLAIAFVYFAQCSVDVAVIEVGIGGTLDGTNVIVPEVSVITNIGLDHTEILGPTLESIASDKAGIAKPGIPLISDVEDPSARAVIEARCAQVGAPFVSVRDTVRIEPQRGEPYGQSFRLHTGVDTYELSLPVLGGFQQRNAATAVAALERLPPRLKVDRASIELGFSQLVIPGRMEFFPSHPSVVFDIAHNPDKARSLASALEATFAGRRFTFVLAITETKDVAGILEPLAKLGAQFVVTSFDTAGRTSVRPQRLASMLGDFGAWGRAISDPVEAFQVARRNADADGVVVVTGSTFVVAALRDWWFANVVAA